MNIHASSVIRHPRARVFHAFRNELPKVAAFMPNIQQINTVACEDATGGARVHNEWIARGEIPKVAQGIIKPEMLRWDDHAVWDDANTRCTWTLKLRVFTDNVRCSGQTVLTDEAGGTRVTLTGTLEIDLKNIPGVPRFLAGTISPQVEKFVVALVTPNLEQMTTALGRYLDSQA